MDKKLSEYEAVSTVKVQDVLPIISDGSNRTLTIGTLSLNFPNIGNKGITKNIVVEPLSASIPLTSTVYRLNSNLTPYTLSNGSDGQEIVIVALGSLTISVISSYFLSINMGESSSLTLIFIGSISKWIIKSEHNCTFP